MRALELEEKKKRKKKRGIPVVVEEDEYAVIKPIEEEKKKPEEEIKPVEEIKPKGVEKPKREKPRKAMIEKLKKLPIDMLETDVDKLMGIIEEKKSVNVGDLSKELHVEVEQIENWAKILEEHGLIEIEYPIIGLPILRRKEWKEES